MDQQMEVAPEAVEENTEVAPEVPADAMTEEAPAAAE
jgi:hypothetical protein